MKKIELGFAAALFAAPFFGVAMLFCCGGNGPGPVTPNPLSANCLAERQSLQLSCVQRYRTRAEIDDCLRNSRLPDCSTEAGLAAFGVDADK